MAKRQYWLMKSEPEDYSIDDLKRDLTEPWTGIRNYAARNFMRDDMQIGDGVFFYHSSIKIPEIAGTMNVASKPYPDFTQFDPSSKYFDPKSSEENPTWQMVDVEFTQKFEKVVTRDILKEDPLLQKMELFRLARHSITPVREEEWLRIHELAGVKPK